jgi:hypothetical protein
MRTDRHTGRQADMITLIMLLAVLPAVLIMLGSFIYFIFAGVTIVCDTPKLNLPHKILFGFYKTKFYPDLLSNVVN